MERRVRRDGTAVAVCAALAAALAALVLAGCNEDAATRNSETPSISGSPTTQVRVGQVYSFTPTVAAAHTRVGFSIRNKPSWASFNVATGQLIGTPTNLDLGSYSGIVITVSNSSARASLPAFAIAVSQTTAAVSSSSSPSPLDLPLVQPSDHILTFLGSFKAPNDFVYGGGALSTSGNTMYMTGLYYYGQSYVPGLGSFTIPTLNGTPAHDGSNGTATSIVAPTVPVDSYGNPALNCGQAASRTYCKLQGSLVYNGELYITVAPFYDAATGANGFIFGSDTSLNNTSCGAVNTSSNANHTYTRYFAQSLGVVPAIWQPYLGGPCYVAGGKGLPIDGNQPDGYLFATFDCGAYNPSGGTIPVNEGLDYYMQGLPREPHPEMLSYRSFSGPFPLAGGGGVSYTLTSAPTNGTTAVQLATAFASNTAAPDGPFQITFSDGETRLVHLTSGKTKVPDRLWTCNYGVTGCTSFPALTGCPCTTSVTINPVGDNWYSEYGGPVGYGFIVPGSRTLLYVSIEAYGPSGAAHSGCDTGASGSNDMPISPDTRHYRRVALTAYDMRNIYAALHGQQAVYAASPYADWEFPDWQTVANAASSNCVSTPSSGFFFDPNTSILYGVFGSNDDQGHMVIDEWSVSGT